MDGMHVLTTVLSHVWQMSQRKRVLRTMAAIHWLDLHGHLPSTSWISVPSIITFYEMSTQSMPAATKGRLMNPLDSVELAEFYQDLRRWVSACFTCRQGCGYRLLDGFDNAMSRLRGYGVVYNSGNWGIDYNVRYQPHFGH